MYNVHYDEESQDLKLKKTAYSDLLEATWKQHLKQIIPTWGWFCESWVFYWHMRNPEQLQLTEAKFEFVPVGLFSSSKREWSF
jgi:hypothetical protein